MRLLAPTLGASWATLLLLSLPVSIQSSASSSDPTSRYSSKARATTTSLSSQIHHHFQLETTNDNKFSMKESHALFVRGGGISKATTSPKKYQMEQLLLLQERSAKLREALTNRGLLQDYEALDAPTTPQPVDWECAMATPRSKKSCLYTFDAEPYTKVVCPVGTEDWITLGALNRLRRTDPSKVEPLWHNKFAIFDSWFRAGKSPYSMYAHLPWQGYMLSVLLDGPFVLSLALMAVLTFVLALTRPIWESMLAIFLTSPYLWTKWWNWHRYVHAPLPFKLLIGQMTWKGFVRAFSKLQGIAREYLIQVECRIWEEAIPLTVGEGSEMKTEDVAEEEEDGDQGDSDSEEEDSDS